MAACCWIRMAAAAALRPPMSSLLWPLAATLVAPALALDNGVGLTPGMHSNTHN
jgi:hypothetical protein